MVKKGIDAIAIERSGHKEKGFSDCHDLGKNSDGQLRQAAELLVRSDEQVKQMACYKEGKAKFDRYRPDGWDADKFNKMMNKPYSDRLVIAGSLIAAEYDRIHFWDDAL